MADLVVIDTNLLMLIVVGSASIDYIRVHKRLQNYDIIDFITVTDILGEFSEIVFLPHILAEASNLLRQIANPAKDHIQARFRHIVSVSREIYVPSLIGAARDEFAMYGLTDAVILSFCDMELNGDDATLVTADTPLANVASSLGFNVIDYHSDFSR